MRYLFLLIVLATLYSCSKEPVACGTTMELPKDSVRYPCTCTAIVFDGTCSINADQWEWKIDNNDCRDSLGNLVGYTRLFGVKVQYNFGVPGIYNWTLTVTHHGRHDEDYGKVIAR